MNSLELRHLENLCQRLGIDTHEIDQTLTYRENKRILLERFGIHDQKHNSHMIGHFERLQELAENCRGYPDELMTEPTPQQSLNDFEIIETSQPIGLSQPSGPFVDWQTVFHQPTTREPQGPFADWQTVFRTPTPKRPTIQIAPTIYAPKILHIEKTEPQTESVGFGPLRIEITPNGDMKARLDLLRPFKEHLAVKTEIRLWC